MAETLRELVVSLSLSSDNFDRNIKSVNQRIREAESNFQLAAAGVDGFSGTFKGATAGVDALKKKLELQNGAVDQFEKKLKAANETLTKAKDGAEKQAAALDDNKRAHALLTGEIKKAEAAFKASVKATGDNSEETIGLSLKIDELKKKEKELASEIKNGEGKLDAATKAVQKNEDAVSRAQTGLNRAKGAVKETTSALDKLTGGLGKAGAVFGVLATKAIAAGESMERTGKYMSTRVTAPLAALGAFAFKAAVDFESAFAGVRKTVNATEEEFAQLEQSVKDMSLEVPSTTTVIAGVMEAAGQLGIATESLEDYTRTMIDLGNSTNLAAEEAATAIAQFSNITGMAQGDANRFGSALVDLGNNFATNEQAIMNMASRLAAAGSQVGLSEAQILGFATALSSVGIEAEAGGSAFSKVMTNMEVAVATGKNGLEDFAKVSGMTNEQFISAWKTEPAKAIESFIVGLSKMDEEGISAIATLDEMGISEVRLRDTLLRATNATEEFARAQSVAASAWAEGTALATEAEQRYGTVASQLGILKNRVSLAAQSLGTEMVPMAKSVIAAVSGLIDRFMALDTEQKEQIIKWGAIAAAVGPALIVLGKITSGAGKTIQAILGITRAMKSLGAVNLGWIGLAVAGVAGLAIAIKALVDSTETYDKAFGRLFNNYDREMVKDLSAAFNMEIETNVTVGDYKEKIEGAINTIKDELKKNEKLSDKERAEILSAIANRTGVNLLTDALAGLDIDIDTQPVVDAILTASGAISTAVESLGLSDDARKHIEGMIASGAGRAEITEALQSFGVEPGAAKAAVDSIFGEMNKITTAAAKLGLDPKIVDAIRVSVVNDKEALRAALLLLGFEPKDIEPILKSYDLVSGTLPARFAAAMAGAYAKLTDGLADTKEVMQGIKDEFDAAFKAAIDEINESAEEKIAELDPTAGDYQEKVDEIRRIQEEHTDEVENYQAAAWGIISGLANKSKGDVEAAWADVEELLGKVTALVAQYEDLEGTINQTRKGEVAVVKAGAARDPVTAASALGYVNQQYKLDTKAIEDDYNQKMAELNANFDDKDAEAYKTAADAAATAYAAANAARLEEYRAELAVMWAGLADSLAEMEPELAEKLKEQANLLLMQDALQGALDEFVDTNEIDFSGFSESLLEAIASAGPGGWTVDDLLGMTPEAAASLVGSALTKVEAALGKGVTETDMGWLDEVMQTSIENGLFAPFEDIDVSTPAGKLKAAMGQLGENAGVGFAGGMDESSDKAITAATAMGGGVVGALANVLEVRSPSKATYRMGGDLVDGLVQGVRNSTWKIRLAMIAMAQEAIKAAKNALGIASPSAIFRDEIGKMMVRGVGVGVESETEAQRRTIANAARVMTASARDGVRAEVVRTSNDNRNQSVTVKIENFSGATKQDIEALAQRIGALQRRAARGVGY